MLPLNVGTILFWSSTAATCTGGEIVAPGAVLPGCRTNTSFVAGPVVGGVAVMSNAVLVSPPVQVAAVDDQNNIVPTFSGSITIAIGHNGGLLRARTLSGNLLPPPVDGGATFPDPSNDPGGAHY